MNVNKVFLLGRVTQNPEVKSTQGGQSYAKFSMATNKIYVDKTGKKQEQVEFHNVIFWGKVAENVVGKYVAKGSLLFIEGHLSTQSYEKEGVKRYSTQIVGESLQLGPRPAGTKGEPKNNGVFPEEASQPEGLPNANDVPF
jgi:single-strand DNA-binding protein